MDDIEAVFNRKDMTFEEAVQYFKERVPVTASVFYGIAEKYRGLAFTVGGYTKAQILKRFYEEILAALEQGNPLSEFRRNMNEFLEAEGYEGHSKDNSITIICESISFLIILYLFLFKSYERVIA